MNCPGPVEGLVGVRMTVPAELLGHHAHADLMIVDAVERDVGIVVLNEPAERQRVDDGRIQRVKSHRVLVFANVRPR